MIEENRAEFEKANILKWWRAGYMGEGVKIAVLELSPPADDEFTDHNFINFRSKAKNNDGHANSVAKVIHEAAPLVQVDVWELTEGVNYIKQNLDEYDVINCSFTGGGGTLLAHAENFPPIFCAAGNNGKKSSVAYPAKYAHTLAIGAFEEKNNLTANYSQGGKGLDCVAFTDIFIPAKNEFAFNGTSCAAPMAAAMTALWIEKAGRKNWQEVRNFIQKNCVDVMEAGHDNYSGYGLFVLPNPETVEGELMKIEMFINNKTAFVDGKKIELARAPEEKGGTTLVPIRFVAENLGCEVAYEPKTRKITILKKR